MLGCLDFDDIDAKIIIFPGILKICCNSAMSFVQLLRTSVNLLLSNSRPIEGPTCQYKTCPSCKCVRDRSVEREACAARCGRAPAAAGAAPRKRGPAARPLGPRAGGRVVRRRQRASVGKISAKFCSFSAVSAPIFARKYAFCSIFKIYQILKLKFLKFDKILQILRHLHFFC